MKPLLKIGALVQAHYKDRANLHRILELGQLVHATTALVHELQKERGLSSGFVASGGIRFGQDLAAQVDRSRAAQGHNADAWDTLDSDRISPALASALATARSGLADLGRLRDDVAALAVPSATVFQGYTTLVDRLLQVVAEAPGTSPHPQVTLALIALFHFVLAKEFAGQERALGSAICAQGQLEPFQATRFGKIGRQRLEALEVFARHASAERLVAWEILAAGPAFSALEALRGRLAQPADGGKFPDPAVWFDQATVVIDLLRTFETELLSDLDHLCLQVLAEARSAWEDSREVPEERESLVLRRLERTQKRLLTERQVQRRGRSSTPGQDLVQGSGRAAESAHRWVRDLGRLDALAASLEALARKAKILSLDAKIEAFRRDHLALGAHDLAEGLEELTRQIAETRRILTSSAGRTVEDLEAFHAAVLGPATPEGGKP